MLNSYSMNDGEIDISAARHRRISFFTRAAEIFIFLHGLIYMSCLSVRTLSSRVSVVQAKFCPALPPPPSRPSSYIFVPKGVAFPSRCPGSPSPTPASSLTIGFSSRVSGLPVEVLSFLFPNSGAQ
jgi:hypothetical protein